MKKLYTIVVFCLLSVIVKAQTAASYTFSQGSGTYQDISGATAIYTTGWDDNVTNGLSIGFTFNHCGTNYTTFNVCANGWISFGSSITNTYTPLSTKTNAIAALGGDLYRSTGGTVSYVVSGTSPNRICIIQWLNVCHFSSSLTGPLNFQIRLYETKNEIELMYGNFSPSSSTAYTYHVGINGNATSDYNNRTTTTNWAATTAGTSNTATCRQSNTIKPSNGLIFKWCPPAPAITGTAVVCAGATTTLSNAVSGGTWSSSSTSVATVGTGSGVVTGVSGGTVTISYTPQCGARATRTVTVLAAPAVPTGSSTVCTGLTTTLTNSSGSGTWASSSVTVAPVGSTTGIVTGLSTGTANISFTLASTGCVSVKAMTVNPSPAATTGSPNACIGFATTLSNGTTGGVWSSSNTSVATVGSSSGVVSGITAGTSSISYTLPAGCASIVVMTVNPQPAAIGGAGSVCGSLSTTLTDATTGGTWSSSSTATATIGSLTGVVTGGAAGSATVTYTMPTGCYMTHTMSVHPLSAITGTPSMCIGYGTTLSNATPGGTWSSSNTGVATVAGGVVTSVSLGTVTISYTMSGTGCTATLPVAVTNTPAVYPITGGGAYCAGGTGVNVGLLTTDAGVIYQLYNGTTAVGAPIIGAGSGISFGLQTTSGPYGVMANPGTPCATTMSGIATVTVNALPTAFTVSGGGSYCAGDAGVHVYLSSSTIGTDYQLYNGSTAVGSPVSGTSAALDFGLFTTAGTYTVVARNTATECINNMSGSATISINPLPAVHAVTGGGGYCAGGSGVVVGLAGSNSGISYQLMLSGSATGSPMTGTGSALSFGLKTTGGSYTVVATNTTTGCTNTMSGSATVVVNALPTVFTMTGGGNYCSGGTGVAVGLNSSTTGVNYQLFRGAVTVGSPVAGTNTAISFGLQTTTGAYTVVATNATTGCVSNMSGSATVGTNPLPATYSVTGGGGYCAGGTGMPVGLSGSVIGTDYYLYIGSTLVGAASGTGAAVSFGLKTTAGTYTAKATIAATGCTANMSGSVSISINPLPTSTYTVTGGGNYCAGGTGVTVGLSGSQTGIQYQLYASGTPSGALVAGTGSAITFGLRTVAGAYTVVGTNSSTTCTANMGGSTTIAINPLPVVHSVTGGGAFCAGGTGVHVGLSSSNIGTNYQLYNGSVASGPAFAGTSTPMDFGLRTAPGIYTVVATNTGTSCVNTMGGSAMVSADPLPAAFSVTGGGNYCAGGAGVSVGLSNSVAGINYQLYIGSVADGASIAGTGAAISFGVKTTPGTYTVMATNISTACSNIMTGSAVVAINVLPTVHTVTGGGDFCAGGTGVHIGLNASNSGILYQLYEGGTAVGAPVAGTGSDIDFGLFTAAGTYTVEATHPGTTCSNNMSGSVPVVVNPLPTPFTVTGGGSYCAGGSGFSVGLGLSELGISYQLFRSGVPTTSVLSGSGFALDYGVISTPGSYTVLAVNGATGCTQAMSSSASIVMHPLPAMQTVTGGGNYCAGGSGVHIGIDGSDAGIEYQLYNGTVMVGGAVPGTGSSVDFGSFTASGIYYVTAVSTTTTCAAAMLGSAAVGIDPLPVTYSVTGGGNYCVGGTGVNIGTSGSNSGISYQLFRGTTPEGMPVAGTGLPVDFGLQTIIGTYTVVATGTGTGCTSNMTGSTTVGTSPLPVAFSVTGGGNYCAGGSGLNIGLSASATGTTYQLYLAGVATGSPLPGTGSTINFGLQTDAGAYTVVATSTGSVCSNNMLGAAAIGIQSVPAAYPVTGGGSYCLGGSGVHIVLAATDPGFDYQLFNGTVAVGTPLTGGGSSLDMGSITAPGTYNIVATDPITGCSATMTGTAAVAVTPLPVAYGVTGGGAYCSGDAGSVIGLSSSDAGLLYQLYNGTTTIGSPVAGTGMGIDFGPQSATGIYTVIASDVTSGCDNTMVGSASISVNPLPAAYSVTGGGNVCSGAPGLPVGLTGSDAGNTYQLFIGGTATGVPATGTGAALDFGVYTSSGTYTVAATNTATGCTSNMLGMAAVVVNALPPVFTVTGGGSYCSGGTGVNVSLTNSTIGINYQLYNGMSPVGIPVMGSGGPISFGPQALAGTYTAVATNLSTSCSSNMFGGAAVVVNSLPAAFAVTGGGNYCAGDAGVHIGLSGSVGTYSYQLFQGTAAIGSPITGSGFALDLGVYSSPGMYTIVATDPTTSCTNSMAGNATVGVNDVPAAYTLTGGGSYCAGGSGVHVGINGSGIGIDYQLFNGSSAVGIPVSGTGSTIDFGVFGASGTYSVVATNSTTGCTRSMTGGAVVTANPLPVLYAVTGGGSYCAGGAGVHIGLGNSTTGVQYHLYNGSSVSGTPVNGTGASIDFGFRSVAGTYTVIATNTTTACASNMPGSATVSITPNVTTAVSIVTGGDDTSCAGSSATLTAVPTNGGSSPSYHWSVNGVTRGSLSTFSYMPANGDIVVLTMGSSIACATPASASNTKTLSVLPTHNPVVNVETSPGASVCQGTTVNFSATPVYGGSAPTYQWMKNGSPVGTASTYSYIPADGDVVYCEMTSNYRCRLSNTASNPAINMNVTVPVNPTVQITVQPGLNIAAGQATTFRALVANGGPMPGFQWLVNGTPVAGATGQTFVTNNLVNGDVVSCDVLSSGPCAGLNGTKSVTVHVYGVGVQNVGTTATSVQLIPNPNKGVFFLKGSLGAVSDREVSVEVTDMLGHVVYRNTISVTNGEIDGKIELGNISNGMYLLNMRSSVENKVFHVVVEQ